MNVEPTKFEKVKIRSRIYQKHYYAQDWQEVQWYKAKYQGRTYRFFVGKVPHPSLEGLIEMVGVDCPIKFYIDPETNPYKTLDTCKATWTTENIAWFFMSELKYWLHGGEYNGGKRRNRRKNINKSFLNTKPQYAHILNKMLHESRLKAAC